MRINEKSHIIEDDPKLSEDPLRHRKGPVLISFDNHVDIPLAPDDEPKGSEYQ
jgi:hypothetical protein